MIKNAQLLGIGDILKKATREHSLETACICGENHYSYSYIYSRSLGFAGGLKKRGLNEGERVIIFLENSIETIISIFGTAFAGGVFSVINPQVKDEKLNYILKDSEASFMVSNNNFSHVLQLACDDLPKLKIIITNEDKDKKMLSSNNYIQFDALINEGIDYRADFRQVPTKLAALIYTSGSTGEPKGVMMSHQSMLFTMNCLVEYLGLDSSDRLINFLPLSFDYGLYQIFMTFSIGATLILEKNFVFPRKIEQIVNKTKATVFPGVPTVFKTLISQNKKEACRMESIRIVTNTAAALSADIIPDIENIFPNSKIFKMYGQTECKRISYLNPDRLSRKPNSVGRAIPGTEIYLQKTDGSKVGVGECGKMYVKGPHIMMGYWNKSDETKKVLSQDTCSGEKILCTHDWFTIDEEGDFYFQGRSDEIINTRGEKVSPIEVEKCLDGLDGISDSAVVGIPDELWGEAVIAFVVLNNGSDLTENQVKKLCSFKLENYMIPKNIYMLEKFPMTNTGKVRKKDLIDYMQAR